MSLIEEIKKKSKTINIIDRLVSIGEITYMYENKKLIIEDKTLKWSIRGKSNFIESILIGMPIHFILAKELSNGKLEIVSGLQKILTILEFEGLLVDKDNNKVVPLKLVGTKSLPSLKNKSYDYYTNHFHINHFYNNDANNYFDDETIRMFDKTKLLFKIITKDNK